MPDVTTLTNKFMEHLKKLAPSEEFNKISTAMEEEIWSALSSFVSKEKEASQYIAMMTLLRLAAQMSSVFMINRGDKVINEDGPTGADVWLSFVSLLALTSLDENFRMSSAQIVIGKLIPGIFKKPSR